MSQDYFGAGGSSKQKQPTSPSTPQRERQPWQRPTYMTVGSGSSSEHADRLQSMLEQDSGYGSMSDGASISSSSRWHPDNLSDTPTTNSPSLQPGASPPHNEADRRAVQSHIHQLHYNHNRTTLARAITRVADSLRRLQEYNREWPAHYPSAPPSDTPQSPTTNRHSDPRPGLHHTQSTREDQTERFPKRPQPLRRAGTTLGDGSAQAESSATGANRQAPEPRLVTPQLARDFSVLKIDLKMDNMPQTEIMHSLRKDTKALAQLLDGQINKSLRHLSSLRERIEDTSSKVLVTGDLNAGKSTFCNALLRRKVLPEDEQPCTSIFCEVLDVRENGGVEEVHAIPNGSKYDRRDERTYDVFPLDKLEQIVIDNTHYGQCKVYIKDIRTVDQSLLNNGVLDIALIDAPGLNNDSLKTTAVFARQEEIDVVVFVVSAANHFTLSAREFIYDAAREKAFIFMVVNGFDNIRNKQRCQEQVLKQVAHLSPATFKESSELVHFVSSNAVPVAPMQPGSGGPPGRDDDDDGTSGTSSSSFIESSEPTDDPSDSDEDSDEKHSPDASKPAPSDPSKTPSSKDKGKGKDPLRHQKRDFAALESSLRRFILEKRARTKLAPARTYLLNVLQDLTSLATVNRDVAQGELDRVAKELSDLQPVLDQSQKSRTAASDELDTATEETASGVYDTSRDTLAATIANLSSADQAREVPYPGIWDAYSYAYNLQNAMLSSLSAAVSTCEDHARSQTATGVNTIKQLGLLHLGDAYTDAGLAFQPDRMFRRRKDALARIVDVDVEVWDFFDVAGLWERQEKVIGSGMAVTVAGALGGRLIGGVGWVDGALGAVRVLGAKGMQRLILPGMVLGVILASAYALQQIPHTLPRRLSTKLSTQLTTLDFTHTNALRISSEVRKALKIPSDNLRIGLQRNVEGLRRQQEEKSKVRIESETARRWFGNLVRESEECERGVRGVDLETGEWAAENAAGGS